jgi:peptidoglycan/xylan/chitin deacetylase (PgdA/CDA1 family)
MSALMYHDIVAAGAEDASGFMGRDAALYKITPRQFDEHLDAIARAREGSPHPLSVTVTFDDGGVSGLAAAEALEKRGLAGHFFVTVNYIGTRGFLTRSEIAQLRRRGHRVGSHSCSHPLRMGHCAWLQLVDEWVRSRAVLSDILGEDVHLGSVPGGDFAPRVAKAAAQAGYVKLFTSEPTSRLQEAHGVTLIGRFTVRRRTTAATAAAFAAGAGFACTQQALAWNAKKLTKHLAGERYLRWRRWLLRHGDDITWGDQRS